ncbi:MAG: hypothetical protein WD772_00760 [Pseudohongiellaceae bacterium]
MQRRLFVGALGGLAGLAGAGRLLGAEASYGAVIPGAEAWSESLMLLHFDAALSNGISVRVSRYPDQNVTWVWCHVLFEGQLYSFTERRLPCTTARNTAEVTIGRYDSAGAGVSFSRNGLVEMLETIQLSLQTRCHAGGSDRDGPGEVPVVIEATFLPASIKDNLPAGRSEWTGVADIQISVAGQRQQLTGIAKAHEQIQTAPRFNAPFTYAMTWSKTASFIATASPARRYGNLEIAGIDRAVSRFEPGEPGVVRPFRVILEDGEILTGAATRVAHYNVPVFDRLWNGNIVRVELGSHRLIGMMNDWRPEDNSFEFA